MLRRRARHRHADRAALGAAAILALAAAGCGGEDEPAGDGYPAGVSRAPDRVEFLAEADRICESTNARVEAAADDLLTGRRDPPPAQVRRIVIGVVIPALEAEVRAIRALGAPAGDEREVDAIVAATERGIEQVRADPVAVLDGAPQGLRAAARLSRAYGSQQCGVR